MTLSGLGCRLQTCSCLATEWFNSTFRAGAGSRGPGVLAPFAPGDGRQCQDRPSPGPKGSARRAIPKCHRTGSTYSSSTLFPRHSSAAVAVCQAQPKDNSGFNWIFLLSTSLLNCVTSYKNRKEVNNRSHSLDLLHIDDNPSPTHAATKMLHFSSKHGC